MGYADPVNMNEFYHEEIGTLLNHVKSWKGPNGGKGWWYPIRQRMKLQVEHVDKRWLGIRSMQLLQS